MAARGRAIVEGVAFAMVDLLDALSFDGERLLLTGGGARNDIWVQMICDLVGKPVEVPHGSQFGARGAALLAATATGHFASINDASSTVSGDSRLFEPRATGQHDLTERRGTGCWPPDRCRLEPGRQLHYGLPSVNSTRSHRFP